MNAKAGSDPLHLKAAGASTSLAHAWRALVHPITWISIGVLLANDHLLRWRWSSWLTGKLGDVAWLAFAPLVVALGLAVLPTFRSAGGEKRQDAVVAVAIALVGGSFVAVKGIPSVTQAFHAGFRMVFGWPPRLVYDPTDLVTLPALGLAWVVWQRTRTVRAHPITARKVGSRVRRTVWGWGALGLAMVATLGNSGPPEMGIVCVKQADRLLLAGSRYDYGRTGTYESADGGLTWTRASEEITTGAEPACAVPDGAWEMALADSDVRYRFTLGSRVERSNDGGVTWTTDLVLRGAEARMAYLQQQTANASGDPGPHSGVYDPATGNLVLAMGLEGVLVRREAVTASSEAVTAVVSDLWQWAPVGDYQYEPVTPLDAAMQVLVLEGWLAVSVLLVTVAFGAWRLFPVPVRVITAIWALAIMLVLLVLRPALMTGYATMVGWAAIVGLGVGSLLLAVVAGIWISRRDGKGGWRGWLGVLGLGVGAALVFFTPLVLWAVGVIPQYIVAMSIAAVLVTGVWVSRVVVQP